MLKLVASQGFLYATILVVATAISLATGLLLLARIVLPLPSVANYGLPFAWREVWNYSSQNATTNLSAGFFFFDLVWYAAIGYIAAFPYQRRFRTMRTDSPALGLSIAYVWLVLLITIALHTEYCDPAARTCR
jgi:hypothetical protein